MLFGLVSIIDERECETIETVAVCICWKQWWFYWVGLWMTMARILITQPQLRSGGCFWFRKNCSQECVIVANAPCDIYGVFLGSFTKHAYILNLHRIPMRKRLFFSSSFHWRWCINFSTLNQIIYTTNIIRCWFFFRFHFSLTKELAICFSFLSFSLLSVDCVCASWVFI